jgi:hypothetical protein
MSANTPWTLKQARPKPRTTGPDPATQLDKGNPFEVEAEVNKVLERTWLKLRQGLLDMGLDHDRISTILEECSGPKVNFECDLFEAVFNRLEDR